MTSVATSSIAVVHTCEPFDQFCQNGHQWRVVHAHRAALAPADVDWFALDLLPDARRVKHNDQRDVWSVRAGGRDYFVKLYHPQGLLAKLKVGLRGPTAHEEWSVGRYAAEHGIAAVLPVACAWPAHRSWSGTSLLVTEAVQNAVPLNEFWLAIRGDRRRVALLIDSLAALIARAHQCGFRHGDMHPGNILIRPGRHACHAFFVDLHKVRINRDVRMSEVVANIAQLNQWFRRHATRSQRLAFLRRYLAYRDHFAQASAFARNWRIDARALSASLARAADRHAQRLWAKRDRRTGRTSRYFARIRPAAGWRGHVMLQCKHPAPAASASRLTYTARQWGQWLAGPLDWVDPARHQLLKDSHSTTICRAVLPTQPAPVEVVVKRTLARNAWKRVVQSIGPSRNHRAWRIANMMLNRDLPAAQPMAVVERFVLGLFRADSILFTECVVDSCDLETVLTRVVPSLPPTRRRAAKDALIESVVQLLRAFHDRGFVHRDLKAPNLLVHWDAPGRSPPKLTFIDMDGISRARRPSSAQRDRAAVRLCVSLFSSPGCTRTDRLRFLRRYLTEPGRATPDWKPAWRRFAALAAAKLDRKALRRDWKIDHYGRE